MVHGDAKRGPSALELGAYCLLPALALAGVVWLVASHDLPLAHASEWVPALGVRLAWRLDGLSALMLLMVAGVGTAVFVYATGYMAGHPGQRRLFILLILFSLAMAGCVLANDVFLLFCFWEATSVLSFLLVGFEHERSGSRVAALQALLVTGAGGLALLAGLILLSSLAGTTSIDELVKRLPGVPPSPALAAALGLVLVGAFTKSAQFPFHFWLPNAMAAPTPVSAYLHSATMVKLGVYLLARLDAGLDDRQIWQWALQAAGSITAAWGMILAIRETDLKRILAWSTVATLGTLVTLVGLPGESAALAAGALLLAHALYKAPLFFVAGNVDHGTGTRSIDRLGNLRRAMPWTAAAALLAGTSMAGVPLSLGFAAKGLVGTAKKAEEALVLASLANAVFASIAVAVAGVAAVRVFWRHPGTIETPEAHEGGPAMVLPPLALASLGIGLGLFPVYARSLIEAAGVAMTPGDDPVTARLTPLVGPELLSFATTFAVGSAIYFLWEPLHRLVGAVDARLDAFGLARQYERLLSAIPRLAAAVTRTFQHGRSPAYLAVAATTASLAIGAALWAGRSAWSWPEWRAPGPGPIGASALIVVGAVAAAVQRERLAMLLGAGLVGYGSAVLFVFAGAPDVALTQFVVETVFVVVAASVLLALARRGSVRSVPEAAPRKGALLIAAVFATAVTALLLAAVGAGIDPALADFFGSRSVPEAHGRNVVNVILVDFRALDTLGEITVVAMSLLAALPLLRSVGRGESR